MIDDYVISVPVPIEVPPGSMVNFEATGIAIRLAKTCSRLLREILSTKGRRLPVLELQNLVMEVDRKLKTTLDDLPQGLRFGTLAKLSDATYPIARRTYALYLHLSIYGSLLAIHAWFSYPWLSARYVGHCPDAVLEAQMALSSAAVAEAARKILLAIRATTSNVATPSWLAFNYPIYAHLGLFVHVLRYPDLPSASADLGILDICAGHFGHIDFMTSSEISVSLPRESVNLAAKVVKASKKGRDPLVQLNRGLGGQSVDFQDVPEETHNPTLSQSLPVAASMTQVCSSCVMDLLSPSLTTILCRESPQILAHRDGMFYHVSAPLVTATIAMATLLLLRERWSCYRHRSAEDKLLNTQLYSFDRR
jgi:hypothetical protein